MITLFYIKFIDTITQIRHKCTTLLGRRSGCWIKVDTLTTGKSSNGLNTNPRT